MKHRILPQDADRLPYPTAEEHIQEEDTFRLQRFVRRWKPVFLKSVKIAAASGGRQQNRITSWLRQLLPQSTQNTVNDTTQSPPRRRQRTRQTQHVGAQPSRWVTTYMTSFMTRTQQTTQRVTNRASSTIGRWRNRGLSHQITNFFGRREPPNPQQEELDPSLGGDHPL